MPVTAKLELTSTQLLCQETATGTAELINATGRALRGINPGCRPGSAVLLVTNVETGETTRQFVQYEEPFGGPSTNLDPKGSMKWNFSLPLPPSGGLPGPGVYDVQACYEWEDGAGEALSPAVRIAVAPANPCAAQVTSMHGGSSGYAFNAWLQRVDPAKDKYQLWLSSLSIASKPHVTSCIRLAESKGLTQPAISVPPRSNPTVQWVGWLDGQNLRYVLHCNGEVTEPHFAAVPSANCRIVPPLMLHFQRAAEQLPGALALLYEPSPDGKGGQLHQVILQLGAKGGTPNPASVAVPGPAPLWARTAYLSNQNRHTFFLTASPDSGCALGMSAWSPLRPITAPTELAQWTMHPLAADVLVTRQDWIRGVILGEQDQEGSRRYALYQWIYAPRNPIMLADPIPVDLPEPVKLSDAVVRINEFGAAFAVFRRADQKEKWLSCRYDGKVSPVPARISAPVDVLFRRGEDPTIMYTDPSRGFLFVKPG